MVRTIDSTPDHFMPVQTEFKTLGSEIEWWFLQGNYTDKDGLGHFMFTIFSHNLSDNGDKQEEYSHTLLFRLQHSSQDKPYVVSMADSKFDKLLKTAKERVTKTNFNPNLTESYFEEINKYGLLQSIKQSNSLPYFADDTFHIEWEDFALFKRNDELVFRFKSPWQDEIVEFNMKSRTPRVNADIFKLGGPEEDLEYFTYPCLKLECNNAQNKAYGNAWFDHQWGGLGWFLGDDPKKTGEKRLLGWDWFGINLNEETAIIIIISRDMETKNIIKQELTMIDRNGSIEKIKNFAVEPIRYWHSNKTQISYPIEWKISIPSMGDLHFIPSCDDQEIPVLGLTRAIWEGAGSISGVIKGETVSGVARLELNGYGYVFNVSEIMDSFSQRINQHINSFFPEKPNNEFFTKYTGLIPEKGNIETIKNLINTPVWDLIKRNGKLWRPVFGTLLIETLGVDSSKYEDFMSIITELVHVSSLIIDDIEDDAEIRRNQQCIHLKYGTDVAINAANTLYFLPITIIKEHQYITDKQALEIYKIGFDFYVKAHFGQGMDIAKSSRMELLDNADYETLLRDSLNIYALKTAAPLEFIAQTACILANADKDTTKNLMSFARNFGIAFQIKDDIHDFGDYDKWTKAPGEDLANGKLTYVILLALQTLNGEEHNFIKSLIKKQIPATKENIVRGIEIIHSSGALEKADRELHSLIDSSWDKLSERIPQSDAKIIFKLMYDYLLNFKNSKYSVTQ